MLQVYEAIGEGIAGVFKALIPGSRNWSKETDLNLMMYILLIFMPSLVISLMVHYLGLSGLWTFIGFNVTCVGGVYLWMWNAIRKYNKEKSEM